MTKMPMPAPKPKPDMKKDMPGMKKDKKKC